MDRFAPKRALSVIASLLLVVPPLVGRQPAVAAVGAADADFSAYATSTLVHADLLSSGDTRLADVEVGFSSAAAASKGVAAERTNEVGKVVAPAGSHNAYSRGSGLEVGLAQAPALDNQIILAGKAEATAPPSPASDTEEIGPVDLGPVAWASLLKGSAADKWNPGSCVLGDDIARGVGYAADLQLLNTGGKEADGRMSKPLLALDAPTPERAVGNSVSATRMVPQLDDQGTPTGSFGLMSEARQTVAPITLFRNTLNQLTIELLGEWVLRTVATGRPGGASVHYGPAEASPSTPVLRVITGIGPLKVTTILTLQQILGPEGFVLPLPGIGELAIGEDPRAIGGNASSNPVQSSDGTMAAAAVDVLRLTLAPLGLVDVRVGHMEAQVSVPSGGADCPIPVTKTPSAARVSPGEGFTTTVAVTNPFDCELKGAKAKDTISRTGTATFRIDGASDSGTAAGGATAGTVDWDLGTIAPGATKTVSVSLTATGGAGTITDTVDVSGTCGVGSVTGGTDVTTVSVDVPLVGSAGAVTAVGVGAEVLGLQLPRTGGVPVLYWLGAALLASAAVVALLMGRSLRKPVS